jgi:transcription antitermination factor NusG
MTKVVYRIGDMVRIKMGTFVAFTGRVEGINQSKSLLKVIVNIFGRTAVKVKFFDAEKLEIDLSSPPTNDRG